MIQWHYGFKWQNWNKYNKVFYQYWLTTIMWEHSIFLEIKIKVFRGKGLWWTYEIVQKKRACIWIHIFVYEDLCIYWVCTFTEWAHANGEVKGTEYSSYFYFTTFCWLWNYFPNKTLKSDLYSPMHIF